MKTKTLMIALIVTLAVLVGGLFLLKGLDLGEADAPVASDESITLAQVGEVTAITQRYAGTTVTYAVAETGDWVCMEDDTLELDQNAMKQLADRVAIPVATQLVTDDVDRLADFGLEDPVSVTVTGTDGSYTLNVGGYQEFNDTYYVQLAEQSAVYTVPESLVKALCATADSLAVVVDEA